MKCPVCGAETELVGFDGSRVIYQCQENPFHFFSPNELFLKEEFLPKIVFEREERIEEIILELTPDLKEEYPDAKLSMVVIDLDEAEIASSMGSRTAPPVSMEKITKEKVKELNDKYAMTIRVILWEVENRRDFKRRTKKL